MKSAGADLVFVDCNAISPDTTRKVGGAGPRFYASGKHADAFAVLTDHGAAEGRGARRDGLGDVP